eukprot:CAMPEP_0169148130 /NCGR_PEP_ID=MMETSP1015-20121227/48664_1 /TAXON_ID=342587 /ORGANISM="Karlodinium micrum, Strain CCMP2283" /LENGTH=84 /DNA_ID=CAMNT_0009216533 /DNA_START=392 /DNA_END=646 /DNA_ORIENTATION=-
MPINMLSNVKADTTTKTTNTITMITDSDVPRMVLVHTVTSSKIVPMMNRCRMLLPKDPKRTCAQATGTPASHSSVAISSATKPW